ncbi:MAG: redox-regulated ATPase YchF [Candidatus Thermofonsia Clade 1 bacterium]|jgi:GTP-binding protein YchF|uniref:Redox-regulated ATPase YchF n=1 Tax=Candidatus Thermofonsia Clade 1 bacterium TaxID=2364210 RepID=A0A2M8PXC7_9CHLR|nr:MAG: redox-regulated ATPase YchF [Candidatus Thermofonsia Clade 1 bacterium]PJF42172.1 MAG: redox-regulated ATPase YchF [Candidatus Thermofonsia Clade 1 bacterium]RMF51433.1 MAG: redox-regulated ATPase YchF [Chloroflexota bacterium]
MRLGIVGLPNSGKTTIFNALTRSNRPTGAVSGGKLEVFTAVVPVPDVRIDQLSALYKPKKTIYATITYTDIGGLERGIGKEGISGELRNQLQQVEGFIHVVRAFEDESVPHPEITIDPLRDLSTVDTEFLLSDLVTIERRLERLAEERRKGKPANPATFEAELATLERFKAHLDELKPLRALESTPEERRLVRGYGLLSLKPMLVIFNSGEQSYDVAQARAYQMPNLRMIALQGKLEAEIAQLQGEDQRLFLAEYGIAEPGAQRAIRESYELLHIHSFFTVGPDEVRAWTIPIGATAQEAAGVIHSDLARGFIRAEVTACADLLALGSEAEVKKQGKMRLEGKDYIVKDGDILHIRANV